MTLQLFWRLKVSGRKRWQKDKNVAKKKTTKSDRQKAKKELRNEKSNML